MGARGARDTGAREGAYNLRHTNKVSPTPLRLARLQAAPVVYLVGIYGDIEVEAFDNLPQAMACKDRLSKDGQTVFVARVVQREAHAER